MASIKYMDMVHLNLLHKYKNISKRGCPFQLQEATLILLKKVQMFYNRNSQIHAIIQVEIINRFKKDLSIFMVIVISGIITDYGYIIRFFSLRRKKSQACSKYFESVIMENNHFFSQSPTLLLKTSPWSVSPPFIATTISINTD